MYYNSVVSLISTLDVSRLIGFSVISSRNIVTKVFSQSMAFYILSQWPSAKNWCQGFVKYFKLVKNANHEKLYLT